MLLTLVLSSAVATAPTVYVNGHVPSAADSVSIAALGAGGVRMDFNWWDFQPDATHFDYTLFDTAVDAARAQGLTVYATVGYTPQWASSVPGCDPTSTDDTLKCMNKVPANRQTWAAAVTAVVTHFRGRVDCWGIWNEPNLRTFFDGTLDQFANDVFIPAADAVHAADPAARVCGPELAQLTASSQWNGNQGTCLFGSCIRNGWERDLSQLLDRIAPRLDVITHHVYKADAPGIMQALLDGESAAGVLTHDAVKNVIDSKGLGNKEFWLTETGWEHPPQGGTAEADVATRIVDLFSKQEQVCAGTYPSTARRSWPSWTRTYYFHFPYDPGSGWGIVGPNQAPLLPYTALQNWTRTHTTSACAVGSSPDAGSHDAGAPDAGPHDAGTPDAGTPDAGTPDASTPQDSGSSDAGAIDAGAHDGGVDDAGASADAGPTPPYDSGMTFDSGTSGAGGSNGAADSGIPAGGEEPRGCSSVPGPLALVVLAWALRRARRSSSAQTTL